MAKDLIWPTRPILSLIKHHNYEGSEDTKKVLHPVFEGGSIVEEKDDRGKPAVWHGPDAETFSDTALSNVLKIRIRFKTKDTPHGQAKFLIWIDRFIGGTGNPWQREIWDLICFCTPHGDHDNWYYYEREYMLSQDIDTSKAKLKKNTELKFIITGFVWVGETLGSVGHWGEQHSKIFTAVLKPPKVTLVKEDLAELLARQEHYGRLFLKKY